MCAAPEQFDGSSDTLDHTRQETPLPASSYKAAGFDLSLFFSTALLQECS